MATPTGSSSYAAVSLSGIQAVDALIAGYKWGDSVISYSFPTSSSFWSTSTSTGYGPSSGDGEPWSTRFDFLKPAEAARFRDALTAWGRVANIQFTETADNASVVGEIRVAYSWIPTTSKSEAWAYLPDGSAIGGDIWINTDSHSYHSSFNAGSYAFLTLLHEAGHALGLKHPFEAESANTAVLDATHDALSYTLMSYSAIPGNQSASLSFYPTTPMVYDIQAIQAVYGKNLAFNAGDTVYSFTEGSTYLETLWDGGGNNTISYSGTGTATIDLREGHGSRLGNEVVARDLAGTRLDTVPNVWIAYGTAIRNAIGGSGNNTLIGNDLNNTLTGGAAGNTINGGGGDDFIVVPGTGTIDGGTGLDTLVLTGLRDSFTVTRTSSGFTIAAKASGKIRDTLAGVERIRFSDTAVALDTDGSAGTAYRIYQAAFDRKPDDAGLGYWIDKLDKGMSLVDVAAGFFNSAEFKALYGASPSNTELINRLYQNVLHRAPEDSGFNYWMSELDSGRRSQATALAQFSESPENQAQLIGVIQNGMDYTALA
jgi:hypothetical protein